MCCFQHCFSMLLGEKKSFSYQGECNPRLRIEIQTNTSDVNNYHTFRPIILRENISLLSLSFSHSNINIFITNTSPPFHFLFIMFLFIKLIITIHTHIEVNVQQLGKQLHQNDVSVIIVEQQKKVLHNFSLKLMLGAHIIISHSIRSFRLWYYIANVCFASASNYSS